MEYKRLKELKNYDLVPHSYYHDTFQKSFEMAPHCHPYIEIMYCRKGEFVLEIFRKNKANEPKTDKIVLYEKQFVLIDSGTIHGMHIESESPAFISNLEWKPVPQSCRDRELNELIQLDTRAFFESFEGLRRFLFASSGYVIVLDGENVEHYLVHYINLAKSQAESPSLSVLCNLQARFIQLLTELDKCFSNSDISTGINYIRRAQAFIKNNFNRALTVEEISAHTGITKGYLQRLFNSYTGMSILQYLNNYRIAKCKKLLLETSLSVDEICNHVGFNNRQQLIYEFKARTGITPTAYRNDFAKQPYRHPLPEGNYISSDADGNPIQ